MPHRGPLPRATARRARPWLAPLLLGLGALSVLFAPVRAVAEAPTTPAPSASERAQASLPARVDAARIQRATERFARDVEALGASAGAAVATIPDRAFVATHDADSPRNPASNAKLATAVSALSRLGPDHRFLTGVYGELRGTSVDTLVLRGRGDPELDTAALVGLARQLHVAGVRQVKRIVVDQGHFSGGYVPPAFDQQPDEWASFRAPIAATSLDRNTVTLWLRATKRGENAVVTVEPPGFVDLVGGVATGPRDSSERIQLELVPEQGRLVAKLGGSVPEGARLVPITRRVDDPSRLAGYGLAAVLRERGIEVQGPVEVGSSAQSKALALHRSRPLSAIVAALGKDSDNFTAEMLFATLGASSSAKTRGSSAGASAVEDELRARGAFPPGTKVLNGSGLFDANRATARGLVDLLTSAATDPRISHETIAHLAVAGVDGTLRNRLTQLGVARTVRAKTGTLAASIALSGYVLGPDGAPLLAFSLLVDRARGKTADARKAIDRAAAEYAAAVGGR